MSCHGTNFTCQSCTESRYRTELSAVRHCVALRPRYIGEDTYPRCTPRVSLFRSIVASATTVQLEASALEGIADQCTTGWAARDPTQESAERA